MSLFHQLSLRNKITFIIVFTTFITLTIGLGINLYSQVSSIKNTALSEKTLTAKIVSNYTTTDLIFNNKKTALESLSYLNKDTSILNAHLYDASGQHFVSLYKDQHQHHFDKSITSTWHSFNGNELDIIEPITLDNQIIGSLYLHTSIKDDLKSIEDSIKYIALILVALVIFSFIVAGKLSQIISTPISTLTEALKNYSRNKNQQLNLTVQYNDETGKLIQSFNEMVTRTSNHETMRDIAEKKLKDNERNLNLILNNLADSIITINEKGIILTFNKSAETMFGFTPDEITNKNINILIADDTTKEHDSYIQNYIDTDEEKIIGTGYETNAQNKNKDIFPIRLMITKLPRDLNNKRLFIVSCQDLTLIKQQENQIRRTLKMDALGKLTGGIAHDYNNMLGVVMGYSDLLKEALKDNHILEKYASEIYRAGERGTKLTRKLLTFSRQKQSYEASPLNLNTLLLEERDMLKKTLTVSINLTLNLADDLWLTLLDSSDMGDVILNMCINSMHAMDGNGNLTIQTNNEIVDNFKAQTLAITEGNYVTLSIIDSGFGIDDAIREKIFDPFFSTKGDKGTGLGLSQVYGFVKQNKGEIKVYSELGEGTQFKLYFPRYISDEYHHYQEKTIDIGSADGHESILVVDDEKALRDLAYDILSTHGYHVICAESAGKALEILETETFDLLLTDIIMPKMNGYQLVEIVNEKYPELKILFASGFADNRHEDMNEENSIKNLLQKPYNSNSLLQKISELLK